MKSLNKTFPPSPSAPTLALEQSPAFQQETTAIYTCPMHPEIRKAQPGYCPICGMALEPVTVTEEPNEENPDAKDMTRRFWIATVLTAPVFLLAMAHFIPIVRLAHWISPRLNQWIQFLFTTPVVLWAGWPFFVRCWNSLRTRHLNMFTLIALGVSMAYGFSVAALFFPQESLYEVRVLFHLTACWPDCVEAYRWKWTAWAPVITPRHRDL